MLCQENNNNNNNQNKLGKKKNKKAYHLQKLNMLNISYLLSAIFR